MFSYLVCVWFFANLGKIADMTMFQLHFKYRKSLFFAPLFAHPIFFYFFCNSRHYAAMNNDKQ